MSPPLQAALDALRPLLDTPAAAGHRALLLEIGGFANGRVQLVSSKGTHVPRTGAPVAGPAWDAARAAAHQALAGLPPLQILLTTGGAAWRPQEGAKGPSGVLAPAAWPAAPRPWAGTIAALPAVLPPGPAPRLLAHGGIAPETIAAHGPPLRPLPLWPAPAGWGTRIQARRAPGGILVEEISPFGQALLLWAMPDLPPGDRRPDLPTEGSP